MATTGKTCNTLLILLPTFGLLLTSCMAANVLTSGQTLGTGQYLNFAAYQFIMQTDCNLVLYDNGNAVWASGTNGRGAGCRCTMQWDGNLVVYTNRNQAVWASNTNYGTGNYQLILQRDRNVVIYNPSGNAIWATGTNVAAAAAANVTLSTTAGKPTNITMTTTIGKPTNITMTTAKLNNVTVTPAKKPTAGNPTDVTVTLT